MKRRLIFAGLILLIAGSLFWTERKRVAASASPAAVLYFIADSERELIRLPVAFTAMSDAEEIKLGDELARENIRPYSAPGAPSALMIENYVREVGGRVAAHAHRRLPYRFHYVNDPSLINAFALPGGHVFLGSGLLALMDSEDELAAVLGHEIEHIDHYHAAERAQTQEALRKIPLGGLVAVPLAVFEAGYSKDEELEADREGTRLAVAAGYSPLGALRMFQTFDRLYREYVIKAQTPQDEVADVALQTLEGYFRSHPLPSERIAQLQRMISAENWSGLTSERPLEIAYVFWTERAQRACTQHQYQYAVRAAAHSLKLRPDQPGALKTLGRAEFMLADFQAAAATDRQFLEKEPADVDVARLYALALSARGDPPSAARELGQWLSVAKLPDPDVAAQMEVEEAGLWLLAGNPKPASAIEERLKKSPATSAPASLGRLGWWNYRAGRYDHAADLLSSALEQRPQATAVRDELGWALIAEHKYDSALDQFMSAQAPIAGSALGAQMGVAVAAWDSRQADRALDAFEHATAGEPFWLNDRWVKALYAPDVSVSIAEMQAERERRQQKSPKRVPPSAGPGEESSGSNQ
jgi:beta-barrel assembly-enhancing protease